MYSEDDIKDASGFEERLYPAIVREVTALHQTVFEIKGVHKIEIIISFLKFHSIKMEWLAGNKEVTGLMTSGLLATTHLESLFNACKNNSQFSNSLEAYIKVKLT